VAGGKEAATITFNLGADRTARRMFFNAFSVRRGDGLVRLEFAHVSEGEFGRECSDRMLVAVTEEFIEANRTSFLQYLGTLGQPENVSDPPPLPPCRGQWPSIYGDFVGLARQGSMGEIVFHAVTWKILIERRKAADRAATEKPPEAELVAVLRSDLETHRRWITALYGETKAKS
jgi:hypothetical protein